MILQFFASILTILGLIFAPLEAGLALSSNSSSSPEEDSSTQGSVAASNMGSAILPQPLAGLIVPESATTPNDFGSFEADRGTWVGVGDYGLATLKFTINSTTAVDEDGNDLVLKDDNRAKINATVGCTELSTNGFIGITPVMETTRMIRLNDCEPQQLADQIKIRTLFDSQPRLYVEGDTLWVASQTQVARFDRVEN